jgi:hypothetical protein
MLEARKNRAFEAVFDVYLRRLLRRHFAALRVEGAERIAQRLHGNPIILYGNHGSWWDALLPYFLSRRILKLDAYAMMDERQLARHSFFRRLGVFSVDRENPRNALRSIEYAAEMLRGTRRALWMYPQGELVPGDAGLRRFESGILRIIRDAAPVVAHPFAFRYEFRREQRPEAFVSIGTGIESGALNEKDEALAILETALAALMERQRSALSADELGGYRTALSGAVSRGGRNEEPGRGARKGA